MHEAAKHTDTYMIKTINIKAHYSDLQEACQIASFSYQWPAIQ